MFVFEQEELMRTSKNNDDKEYCKVSEIAKLFELSVRRIQQLTQDGVIETVQTSKGKQYEKDATIQKYIRFLSNKAYGKASNDTEIQLKQQKLRAEIALKESQGEIHKLKTDIAAGRYISVEEIKMDYSRFFISFKNFAMSIPNKLAGKLMGFMEPIEVRKIEKDLQKEVTKLLNDFVVAAIVEEKGGNSGKAKD